MSKNTRKSANSQSVDMDEDINMQIPTTSFYSPTAATANQPEAAKNKKSPKPRVVTPRRKYTRRSAAGKVLRPTQWEQILPNLRNSRLRQLVTESGAVKEKPKNEEMPSTSNKKENNDMRVILNSSSESDFSDMEETSAEAGNLIPPAETPESSTTKRKFFKSGHNTKTPKQVSLFENVKAKVHNGRITLMKEELVNLRRQKQAAENVRKERIQKIIKALDDSNFYNDNDNNNNNNNVNDPENLLEEQPWPHMFEDLEAWQARMFKMDDPKERVAKYERAYWKALLNSYDINNSEIHKIFHENTDKEKMREVIDKYVAKQPECRFYTSSCGVIPLPEPRSPRVHKRKYQTLKLAPTSRKNVRRGWGANQRQIDAGQRDFGFKKCMRCGLVYSPHEPEDEQVHRRFHQSQQELRFKPWQKESIVAEYPKWSPDGRILRITENCSARQKERLMEIIKVVDTELGFSNYNFPESFVAFLAVSNQEAVGVCIVEPLKKAYKHVIIDGQDCRTEEQFPASAGISRIWVSPRKRRQGIATALFEAVKKFTTLFQPLNIDTIAFSAPTANGLEFAKRITNSHYFLVYE